MTAIVRVEQIKIQHPEQHKRNSIPVLAVAIIKQNQRFI
jgi:hypothetical protein